MRDHPSGRPIRNRIVKQYPSPRGTSPGFYNARLNDIKPDTDTTDGIGFLLHTLMQSQSDDEDLTVPTTMRTRQ